MLDGLLCDANLDELCGSAASTSLDDGDDELEVAIPEMPPVAKEEAAADIEGEDPGVVGRDPWCTLSSYGGAPSLDEKELADLIGPDEDGGLVWTAKLVPSDAAIKPRRGMPFPVTTEDFLSSVKRIGTPIIQAQAASGYDDLWERDARASSQHDGGQQSEEHARWVFQGVLNGWPGLTLLEVRRVRVEKTGGFSMGWSGPGKSSSGKTIWDAEEDGNERGVELADAINGYKGSRSSGLIVELRAPTSSARGWSERSPGFVFWVEGMSVDEKSPSLKVTYGTDIRSNSTEDGDPACTMVHMINHRYATGDRTESAKDKLTYHSIALLEWEHRKYVSVVEIGYLNGLGGYKGKSNWVEDKDATPHSQLYAAMPPEMVLPWKETLSEIRVTNVPYRDKDDFVENYMRRHGGHRGRFVDVTCSFSHEVRLTYNSRSNVATYLVNYILRDKTYSEMRRNCQTFTADLCAFLAGKRNISPYHPVQQIQYRNSTHTFLYESSKYSSRTRKKSLLR